MQQCGIEQLWVNQHVYVFSNKNLEVRYIRK